ncbi:hypothetical protein DLAC_10478 [Tieghemostelium lacteum]|uniref:Uncharacterized protein n=1 Tax=Tieghemostelium lacteum TaxID=361077 RepID=A0A151Z519_TIELA|nr:hypothetical protein DLAC_10478 [Tieghemostelium lacteum]|eukprot:KYQ88894.1 hypothetical protein DLAC_10478 [Tieghemostelium lacteum]
MKIGMKSHPVLPIDPINIVIDDLHMTMGVVKFFLKPLLEGVDSNLELTKDLESFFKKKAKLNLSGFFSAINVRTGTVYTLKEKFTKAAVNYGEYIRTIVSNVQLMEVFRKHNHFDEIKFENISKLLKQVHFLLALCKWDHKPNTIFDYQWLYLTKIVGDQLRLSFCNFKELYWLDHYIEILPNHFCKKIVKKKRQQQASENSNSEKRLATSVQSTLPVVTSSNVPSRATIPIILRSNTSATPLSLSSRSITPIDLSSNTSSPFPSLPPTTTQSGIAYNSNNNNNNNNSNNTFANSTTTTTTTTTHESIPVPNDDVDDDTLPKGQKVSTYVHYFLKHTGFYLEHYGSLTRYSMTSTEGKHKENRVLKDSCTNKYNLNKRKEEQKKTKDITSQTIKLSALSSIHANHATSNEIEYISITDDSPVDDFITKFMNPYDQQLFSLPYLFGIQRLSEIPNLPISRPTYVLGDNIECMSILNDNDYLGWNSGVVINYQYINNKFSYSVVYHMLVFKLFKMITNIPQYRLAFTPEGIIPSLDKVDVNSVILISNPKPIKYYAAKVLSKDTDNNTFTFQYLHNKKEDKRNFDQSKRYILPLLHNDMADLIYFFNKK